ncbi:Spo0B domain-containing protein [Paenibacillus gansuensis]|uniref:Spo0B domain-containing protein n=1 Tax=Paenibacillus gansuensis TaxID=306542 RepID=A0ABW5PC87_9BACL
MNNAGSLAAAAAAAGGLVVLLADTDKLWLDTAAAAAVVAAGTWWARSMRRSQEQDMDRQRNGDRGLFLRTMNHHRHDWMNDLQVLYGYIRLRKYDNLPDFLDKIKDKMHKESQVSKLGLPSLVLYLHSYRTNGGTMELDVEAAEPLDLSLLPIPLTESAEWLQEMIEWLGQHSLPDEEYIHKLTVSFHKEEQALTVCFDLEGRLDEVRLKEMMAKFSRIYPELQLSYTANTEQEEASVTCHVPFHT